MEKVHERCCVYVRYLRDEDCKKNHFCSRGASRCPPHAVRAMNPLAALNLATHDDGVAAICAFPVAVDWLAIALPPTHWRSSPSSRSSVLPQAPTSPPAPVPPPPPPPPQSLTPPPYRLPLVQPTPPTSHAATPLPHLQARPIVPPAAQVSMSTSFPFRPAAPLVGSGTSDALTKRQAAAALVRHVRPYASREVLAPCFGVGPRFVLGRALGALHVPTELGLAHLQAEKCTDARFVLDLHYGSIVQIRHYAISNTVLCIAHASKHAEYVAVPPTQYARVEITYQRDTSAAHMDAPVPQRQDIGHPSSLSQVITQQVSTQHETHHFLSRQLHEQQHFSQSQQQAEQFQQHEQEHEHFVPQQEQQELILGRPPNELRQGHRQWSWHEFCINYGTLFPTGPLIATIRSEPGSASAVFKKESIIITLNDGYAMTFCTANAAQVGGTQARRIAPKRLLPRPTP